MCGLRKPGDGVIPLGAVVPGGCEPLCGDGNQIGGLQEHQALLTAEPAFQPQNAGVLN